MAAPSLAPIPLMSMSCGSVAGYVVVYVMLLLGPMSMLWVV